MREMLVLLHYYILVLNYHICRSEHESSIQKNWMIIEGPLNKDFRNGIMQIQGDVVETHHIS